MYVLSFVLFGLIQGGMLTGFRSSRQIPHFARLLFCLHFVLSRNGFSISLCLYCCDWTVIPRVMSDSTKMRSITSMFCFHCRARTMEPIMLWVLLSLRVSCEGCRPSPLSCLLPGYGSVLELWMLEQRSLVVNDHVYRQYYMYGWWSSDARFTVDFCLSIEPEERIIQLPRLSIILFASDHINICLSTPDLQAESIPNKQSVCNAASNAGSLQCSQPGSDVNTQIECDGQGRSPDDASSHQITGLDRGPSRYAVKCLMMSPTLRVQRCFHM